MTIKEALIISDIEEEILKLFKESDKKWIEKMIFIIYIKLK
jgi:hypothetical protein